MAAYLDLGISITAINNASRPLRQVGDDVRRVGENAQATANRLKAIQVVIAGILINKSIELGRAFAKMAAENQSLDLRMTAFAGSAQKAAQVQEHLSKKFAASGLVVDDLAQNFIDVRNAVQSNEQGLKLIDAMANSVLVLGGNQRNIDNLADSFQKIGGRGYASMRDLNSIIQNTPITLADLARAAGTTSTQFEQSIRMGAMNGAKLIEDFVKASETKVGDFAKGLGSTIGGSMGFIKNALDDAVGDLGKRTDVNVRLAAMFTNIGTSIKNFFANIDQPKIDAFFNVLRDMEPVVSKLITAIANIGKVVVGLADIAARFLGLLPQTGFEYGLIGYVFFGKKGFILGALIGGLDQQVRNLGKTVDQFFIDKGVAPEFFKNDKKKLDKSTFEALADSLYTGAPRDNANSIFGSEKQIAGMKKALEDMVATAGKVGRSDPNGISAGLSDAIEKAQLLRQEIENLSDQTGGRIQLMALRTDGDALGERVQQIKNETNGWVDALEKALTKLAQSDIHLKDEDVLVARIRKQIEDTNNERDRAISKETRLNDIKRQQLFLEQESTRNQLEQARVSLSRESDRNPLTHLTAGLAGTQVLQQVQDKLLEMQGSVLQYKAAIEELRTQQIEMAADTGQVDMMQLTIEKYEQLIAKTEEYMATIDPMEESLKGLRTELGQLFEGNLQQGIAGLLKGTMTIRDVLTNIFSDLIDLGVKFLIQMVEIELFGKAAAVASLATTAPIAMAQAAMWSGPAMLANMATMGGAAAVGMASMETALAFSKVAAMFADGGVPGLSSFSNQVVSGPTMFGMMGEAGDEAIMPLTRIGGKLGVRAEGGGDQSHFHFHSADPESGVKFFMQHMDLIDAGLQQRRRLNHSGRGVL